MNPIRTCLATLAQAFGLRVAPVLAVAALALAAAPLSYAISVDNDTSNKVIGSHRLGAWKLNFTGWHTRSYDNTPGYYRVDFDQQSSNGGYDITIGKNVSGGTKVKNCPVGLGADSRIVSKSITGSGFWWSGYKTIISSTEYYSGLDGQWECYIVDNSSLTPANLVSTLDYLTYLGEANYGGVKYKHYKGTIPGGTTKQMWSIRSTYRNGGYCPVGYFQEKWVSYGISDQWWNLGWSRYVEFYGKQKGHFEFQQFSFPWNQSAAAQR
jgi:hypothetical protein